MDAVTLGRSGREAGAVPDAADLQVQALPVRDALTVLGSSARGLPYAEVAARRERFGANELPRPRRRRIWRRFAAQFTDLFAVVLLVASGITFLAYALQPGDVSNLQLAVAILCVVVLNAVIGFAQEYSAERTAETLQEMVPHTCRLLRDGERREVPVGELVPGDVVLLEAGDAVPADCRVIEAHELAVNNAALTGESEPVGRTTDPVAGGTPLLQARNCVFMGTVVAAGAGKAVVAATAAATEFGRIFRLADEAPQQRTPLQRQVATMARRVGAVALVIGALVFAVRVPSGQPLVETFVFALGVMVALVPEGLPATLSVSLAIGVRRMARRRALVKRLLAVEALGSTTVICTDKTGTLTKAEMTVTQVWADGGLHAVSGVGYRPAGEITDPGPVRPLLRAAALCSNARLLPPSGQDGWRVLGDTTEGALLVAAAKAGLDLAAEESKAPRVAEFPFDSTRKLMSTVNHADGSYVAYVKGAPAELLARCTHIGADGDGCPLTGQLRSAVTAAGDEMAARGFRVLAAAWRRVENPRVAQDDTESGLTFLGLVAMRDPPRPEVVDSVRACRQAGIRIVMMTGDHPLTAEAIARHVGIVQQPHPAVVTGTQLDALDDGALSEMLAGPAELLLCRVSPEHKMRVVAVLQSRAEVVAVTGDGANDAPALKRADIGVAMGASGTDVAREAAVMVLLDDSFASIAAAVRLGRSVYQNIRKFLIYLFSHNIGELAPILAATFVGFPLVPISAVQILAIDLGSDVLPALALGAEPPEPDVMQRPPRSPREPLFSTAVVRRFLFLGAFQRRPLTAPHSRRRGRTRRPRHVRRRCHRPRPAARLPQQGARNMKVLVVGAGRLGTQIAQVLTAAGEEVSLIDIDDDRIAELEGHISARLVAGDACEPTVLEDAGALTTDLLVAATGDDEDNLVISLLAKRQFAVPRVAARINDTDNGWLFDRRWGVDIAVPAATPLISLIEEATGTTDTVALLRLSKAGVNVIETAITPHSRAVGHALAGITLPTGTVVAAVIRNGEPTVPSPKFRLQPGDELLVVSEAATEQDIHAAFQ